MTEGILINIDLTIEGDQLLFDCSNTFSPNGNTQSLTHGIGLENAQSRLQLLYPNAHLVDIRSDNSTYLVRLELNLKTADQ